MKDEIRLVRLTDGKRHTGSTLKEVSKDWQGQKECFLFICPHDDDIVIGAGLLVQLAIKENVDVHILIATDGGMGYCSMEEKDSIAQIRRKETFECYQLLGVPEENIVWLGFPDCQLHSYCGRRPAQPQDVAVIEGHTGLQNALTYHLRRLRPTQCFVPTSSDLHPDHKIVHEELLISLYHATGSIWPELGKPLEKTPYVHEFACYCNFPEPPQLQIRTPIWLLEKKLEAIAAFRSQRQIGAVVKIIRDVGPVEYIRELEFKLYDPREYDVLFEEKE